MDSAIIGLISAVIVAIIAIFGQFIMHKLERKDKLSDDTAVANNEFIKRLDDIDDSIKVINSNIEKINIHVTENSIIESRIRILRFADEIAHGVNHSKDHYDQTLEDITNYENYCNDHPKFLNNITKASIQVIEENFKQKLETQSFL